MRRKIIGSAGIFCVTVLWLGLSILSWLRPPGDISETERRKLSQFPKFSSESFLNGSFASGFESYATDQFPMRDGFRQLKALFHRNILGQLDNNGIYLHNGYLAQIQYPLNEASVEHAAGRIRRIHQKYLADTQCRIFLSIVPDKGYFLAPSGGYPSLDYSDLVSRLTAAAPWAEYTDLFGTLNMDDYYRTDTHWRQENLLGAADMLCERLGIRPASEQNYTVSSIEKPFYGVYRGQAALPVDAETIQVLRSGVLDGCRVFNYETNRYGTIYDESKLSSRDLYDIYLSGAAALLRIENPAAETERELVVFRDSFGSSIVPLLVHGYRTVTLVDTRYLSPEILGSFIEFDRQDVLFLYSTILLNNSSAMR